MLQFIDYAMYSWIGVTLLLFIYVIFANLFTQVRETKIPKVEKNPPSKDTDSSASAPVTVFKGEDLYIYALFANDEEDDSHLGYILSNNPPTANEKDNKYNDLLYIDKL